MSRNRNSASSTPAPSVPSLSAENPTGISPSDEILDRIGVARLLALTPEQVDERVRTRAGANRIPCHALGPKTIRFIRSEVLNWLVSQPQNSKRDYRLSPAARKSLVIRNKQRRTNRVSNQNSDQNSRQRSQDRMAVSA
jgi:hypothetical protein